MKNLIIASTSTLYGDEYLGYLLPELETLFFGVAEIIFVPYARPTGITYDTYTTIVKNAFHSIAIKVKGIHEFNSPQIALDNAKGIFIGGGNTFLLVNELYKQGLMQILKDKIQKGVPYLGTSAGSNVCGPTMQNTNDMPIVRPPSFITMGVIPFNINAHYLDSNPISKHNGETRETRIKEYHFFNDIAVLGLREGSWLEVKNDKILLKGSLKARWFVKNKKPKELEPLTNIFLQFT